MDVHDRSVLKLEWLSLDQLKPDPGNPNSPLTKSGLVDSV
jgi:hypothetical protein